MKEVDKIAMLAQEMTSAYFHGDVTKSENCFYELIDIAKSMQSRLESLENEMQEQCRIIGMSAERELSLIAKIESLEKDADRWRFVRDSDKEEIVKGVSKHRPYITTHDPDDFYAPDGVSGEEADAVVDTAIQANIGDVYLGVRVDSRFSEDDVYVVDVFKDKESADAWLESMKAKDAYHYCAVIAKKIRSQPDPEAIDTAMQSANKGE